MRLAFTRTDLDATGLASEMSATGRFTTNGFVRNPPRLPGLLGLCLRSWHEERWGDGRTRRPDFTADALGDRRETEAILAIEGERARFALEHVGAWAGDVVSPLGEDRSLDSGHPIHGFVDYVATVGDPVLILGQVHDPEGRPQPQNLLLLPVASEITRVGWVVVQREVH